MKQKWIIMAAAGIAAMAFTGCATTNTTSVSSMNDIEHKQSAEIRAFSGQKANVLGPVFFKQDGTCSEIDFLKFINAQMPNAHDVIHVRMEYHNIKDGSTEKEYCKYFGIPVVYTDMSVDEAAKWVATYGGGESIAAPAEQQPVSAPSDSYSEQESTPAEHMTP